ncbi:MAG: GNAT family N-acetyltransferase [Ilumatobacteraceae bacterium]
MGRWDGVTITLPGGGALQCRPATADRADDVPAVLGERGVGGCWCMWWRQRGAEWKATAPAERKAMLAALMAEATPPGVLAYLDHRPVGWCAVAPREQYPRMQASATFGPVDEAPVWAVSCLFIHRTVRRRGVGAALVEAAVAMATAYGAPGVEGIPVVPGGQRSPDLYTGVPSMFEPLGFTEIARREPDRPIVRLAVG